MPYVQHLSRPSWDFSCPVFHMFGKKSFIICIQFSRELECWKHVFVSGEIELQVMCEWEHHSVVPLCKAEVSKFSCLYLFVALGPYLFGVGWAGGLRWAHNKTIGSAVVPFSSWCRAEEPCSCCSLPAPAAGICAGILHVLSETAAPGAFSHILARDTWWCLRSQ